MKGMKLLSIALGVTMLTSCFASLPVSAEVKDTVEFTVQYADAVSSQALTYEATYNDDWFETMEEDGRIAKLSMALSAQMYASKGETENLLTSIGFEIVEQVNYERVAHVGDCDFVTYTIAKREIGEDTLYGVFIRGTAADMQWQSNFNVGEGNVHRGFDTAAQEVFAKLGEVVDSENKEHNKVWITGHSRGGAVGNILGCYVNEHATFVTPDNTLVYNFAVPASTKEPVAYPNIFNYNFAGDVITALPLESWGFSRHGITYTYDTELDEMARSLFTEWTEVDFGGVETTDEFVQLLNKWCPTQADYYKTQFTYSPVNLITKYVVPLLMGTGSFTMEDFAPNSLENLNLYIYVGIHPEMISLMQFFLNNKQAITHGHAPVNYLAYTDTMYPHVHEFDVYVPNDDATCLEDGTKTAYCYDGESDTIPDVGSALGHDFQFSMIDESGNVIHACIRCEETMIVGKDISYAKIVFEENSIELLDGKAEAKFTVVMNGETLVPNEDYSFSYIDNDKIGTAKVKVTGLGAYVNELEATYDIHAHEHVFDYVYQEDATCLGDGTEKAVCYCGEVSERVKEGTALGHEFVVSENQPDERYERHNCIRCDREYNYRDISYAPISIDVDVFNEKHDASCVILKWDDIQIPSEYYNINYTVTEGDEAIEIEYRIDGIHSEFEGYIGTLEGTLSLPYPPDPFAWVTLAASSGAGVVGLSSIGIAVMLGKRRRF